MNRLAFYLFRQLLGTFLFAAIAISFVVLFSQMFRLLSLVINNASTLWVFGKLLGLSVPTFLPLVLPISLGVATLFVYHKLSVDSELVVMRAAGIGPMTQALPGLVLAFITVGLCFVLTLWLTPKANRDLVNLQYKVRNSYAVFLSRPGSFNDITDGLTFFTRKRGDNGGLEGVLIHDIRKPEMPITIMADTGQIVSRNGQQQIVVFNGRRQEMDPTTGRLSELAFDQYVLELDSLRGTETGRLPDPREQTLSELMHPSEDMLQRRATEPYLIAELHQRLASPLLAISYALIGLTALLAGEFNRRGMGNRILTAMASIILTQASFMSLSHLIAKHEKMGIILYVVALMPVPLCLSLLGLRPVRSSRKTAAAS
ncbi:MAG: LptF/LptG family permease [Alphaproteobacteria bacterium]|nr:LptF/LptG family permease [Alphaproteobacteria bacterium]MBV8548982.1 LptF/LptG family permease [Alphaproteobacteria bacterium]